jgi:hypothetical protein
VVLSAEPFDVTITYYDLFEREHAGIYDYHSHMDVQDHFSDSEDDIFGLNQQTPRVKQSKQFL